MKTNTPLNSSGFTLVELILVIAILGMLAVSVAPSFSNLLTSSTTTGGKATAGAIQSAINTRFTQNVLNNVTPFWPSSFDSVPDNTVCSTTQVCFGGITAHGITSSKWRKINGNNYDYLDMGITQNYIYDPANGKFGCANC